MNLLLCFSSVLALKPSLCTKLSGSAQCPKFNNLEFYKGFIDGNFPVIETTLDFDAAIGNYFKANCSLVRESEVPYFSTTFCALMIQLGNRKGLCNQGKSPTICKSSVQATLDHLRIIQTKCPSIKMPWLRSLERLGQISSNASTCIKYQSEAFCGFSTMNAAEKWCLDNQNSCCSSLKPQISTSAQPFVTRLPDESVVTNSKHDPADSKINTAVLLGTVGSTVFVLGMFGFIYMKNRKVPKSIQATNLPETMRVIYSYEPILFDEISIKVGDSVVVKCKFDDGWAFGTNLNSKLEGVFPLACVSPLSLESQ